VTGETTANHPLRLSKRPAALSPRSTVRLVDLFAGCGGLSLGAEQAAYANGVALQTLLAVDFESAATTVYRDNFPTAASVVTSSVEDVFDGPLGSPITRKELLLQSSLGDVDALVGGPPCQGHSNLNNHTRRTDPKNTLYLYMSRAAMVLAPKVVLIENVPAVLRDRHGDNNVVETAKKELLNLGYQVADSVLPLKEFGVAQTRKRHVLLATRPGLPDPAKILEGVTASVSESRDLRWAIGDLVGASPEGWDKPSTPSAENVKRMTYLLDANEYDLPNGLRPKCHQNNHSYKSMYGRLRWNLPAQTLTSGFGSIGQGRYMHPEAKRALTAHEAARIQGFPDYFDFTSITKRGELAVMIGNAVPPQLAERVFTALIPYLTAAEGKTGMPSDTELDLARAR